MGISMRLGYMKLIQNMGKKDLYIVYQEKNRIGYQWTRIWNRVFGFKWCMASYKYIKTAKPRI